MPAPAPAAGRTKGFDVGVTDVRVVSVPVIDHGLIFQEEPRL